MLITIVVVLYFLITAENKLFAEKGITVKATITEKWEIDRKAGGKRDMGYYFKGVYPNPAINSLKIITQNMGLLYSIDSYNLLGEKIELVFNNDNVANVSYLPRGLYFTEVSTNTSKEIVKWVKL